MVIAGTYTDCGPNTGQRALHVTRYSILTTTLWGCCHHSHLTDEETEAWRVSENTTCHLPQSGFPCLLKMSLSCILSFLPQGWSEEIPSLQMCVLSWDVAVGHNLLWPDVALRLIHISHCILNSPELQEAGIRAQIFPIPENFFSFTVVFLLLATEPHFQTFYTEEKEKIIALLEEQGWGGARAPPALTNSLPWRPPRGSYWSSYYMKLCWLLTLLWTEEA